jgi:hypothetical protein
MMAVENNGIALEFAINTFKTDIEIVSKAVTSNGLALQFSSPLLL